MNEVVKQEIRITDRKCIELSGVRSILEFDEKFLRLDTSLGIVMIDGNELRIEDMSKESGRIVASGEFIQLAFVGGKRKKEKGSILK
ncbi:MAG: YabP/YqfC family sporulation protein [Clostridia bacterium]|nr:YabP/YqfC family sporulation protein [Clostridia bacterium]